MNSLASFSPGQVGLPALCHPVVDVEVAVAEEHLYDSCDSLYDSLVTAYQPVEHGPVRVLLPDPALVEAAPHYSHRQQELPELGGGLHPEDVVVIIVIIIIIIIIIIFTFTQKM